MRGPVRLLLAARVDGSTDHRPARDGVTPPSSPSGSGQRTATRPSTVAGTDNKQIDRSFNDSLSA
jgi:hypothetical protein